MIRRTAALVLLAGAAAACGAPQLAAPADVTLAPTTTTPTPQAPECSEEEAALDPTRSYAPDGATDGPSVQAIRDRQRLVVGVSGDTLQFGALNPNTGALEGFDVAILQEVARALFPDSETLPIEYRIMTYAQRLPSLESGDVDLVAHTMTINCNRWLRIGFSSTYYDAGQKVLVPEPPEGEVVPDVQQLVADGARMCVPGGSTNRDELDKPEYQGLEIVEVPDITDCLVAIQEGRADAATGDDTVLVGLAAQDPNLVVVGEVFTNEPYGVGVNAAQVDLVRFVNGVLEDLRASGRWAAIYEEFVGVPAPGPPQPVYGREP